MGKTGSAQLYDNEDDDDDYNGLCWSHKMVFQARERSHSLTGDRHALPMGGLHAQVFVGNIITITIIIIIIIITRPKPPFGRQGLAGSWGKDKVRRVNFGVFSTSHFAHLALSSDWIVLIKCCYSFGGYILAGYILFLVTGAIHTHE